MIAEELFKEEIPMATPGNHMLSPWQQSLGRNANVRDSVERREREMDTHTKYVYTYVGVCIYVCVCMYIYICVYACMYIYIYIYTHTHTHTHRCISIYLLYVYTYIYICKYKRMLCICIMLFSVIKSTLQHCSLFHTVIIVNCRKYKNPPFLLFHLFTGKAPFTFKTLVILRHH